MCLARCIKDLPCLMIQLLAGKAQDKCSCQLMAGDVSTLSEGDQSALMCLNHYQFEHPPCSVSNALGAR